MRRMACWFVCLVLPLACGCAATANEILFGLLQGAYTGEADDMMSRRAHFRSQVEAWKQHERFGP